MERALYLVNVEKCLYLLVHLRLVVLCRYQLRDLLNRLCRQQPLTQELRALNVLRKNRGLGSQNVHVVQSAQAVNDFNQTPRALRYFRRAHGDVVFFFQVSELRFVL